MEHIKKILKNHWTIFAALAIGVCIGIHTPWLARELKPFGQIYINLVIMCCAIMLPAIIISSIGKIVTTKGSTGFMIRIFIALVLTFIMTAGITVISSFLVSPITAPDEQTVKSMGKLIVNSKGKSDMKNGSYLKDFYFIREMDTEKETNHNESNLMGILAQFFPDNIIGALANGQTMRVLIFSIILGFLLKFIPEQTAGTIISFCDKLFDMFNILMSFLLYFLPLGFIAIISEQTMGLDFNVLKPLIKLGLLISLVIIIFFVLCFAIIRHTTRKPAGIILKALKEPMILSFVADNNLIAIPSLIRGMTEDLGLDKDKVNLTAPLWLGMEFHTAILLLAAGAVFTLQLYHIKITTTAITIIIIGSIAAGMSSMAAAPGLWVSLISVILDPLDIPSSAIIFALLLFEPFFNGILYMLNAVISCAVSSILSRKNDPQVKLI